MIYRYTQENYNYYSLSFLPFTLDIFVYVIDKNLGLDYNSITQEVINEFKLNKKPLQVDVSIFTYAQKPNYRASYNLVDKKNQIWTNQEKDLTKSTTTKISILDSTTFNPNYSHLVMLCVNYYTDSIYDLIEFFIFDEEQIYEFPQNAINPKIREIDIEKIYNLKELNKLSLKALSL